MERARVMVMELAVAEGRMAGGQAGEAVGKEEAAKYDFKTQSANCRAVFMEMGAKAGRTNGLTIAKSVLGKLKIEEFMGEVKEAAGVAGAKYAKKALEFQKMAIKIAEEA